MSYELTCVAFEGYVRIRVDGVWPSDMPQSIIADIYDVWAKHRELALLLDIRHMREDAPPKVFEDFETVKLFVKAGFQEIGTMAVLDRTDRETANKFFETAASNQSLRVQFFYASEQEAINWLLEKSGPQK